MTKKVSDDELIEINGGVSFHVTPEVTSYSSSRPQVGITPAPKPGGQGTIPEADASAGGPQDLMKK